MVPHVIATVADKSTDKIDKHLQLSNISGQICVSIGYFWSVIGHANVADILRVNTKHCQLQDGAKKSFFLCLQ